MKKLIILSAFLAMQLDGAAAARTAILVKNDSGLNVDFYADYPQAPAVGPMAMVPVPRIPVEREFAVGESALMAPDQAGRQLTEVSVMRRGRHNELTLKRAQYDLLTTGRAYIQIVSLGGDYVAMKIVPVDKKTYSDEVAQVGKPKEAERKKGAIPGGMQPEAMELVQCRAQLKKCQDDLAAAQARNRALQAKIAEYEPGA